MGPCLHELFLPCPRKLSFLVFSFLFSLAYHYVFCQALYMIQPGFLFSFLFSSGFRSKKGV